MDIKAKVEELVKKITGSKSLLANFKKSPADTVKKLLKVDLPTDQLSQITDLVKAKIDVDDAAEKVSGAANALKGLFGKK